MALFLNTRTYLISNHETCRAVGGESKASESPSTNVSMCVHIPFFLKYHGNWIAFSVQMNEWKLTNTSQSICAQYHGEQVLFLTAANANVGYVHNTLRLRHHSQRAKLCYVSSSTHLLDTGEPQCFFSVIPTQCICPIFKNYPIKLICSVSGVCRLLRAYDCRC